MRQYLARLGSPTSGLSCKISILRPYNIFFIDEVCLVTLAEYQPEVEPTLSSLKRTRKGGSITTSQDWRRLSEQDAFS